MVITATSATIDIPTSVFDERQLPQLPMSPTQGVNFSSRRRSTAQRSSAMVGVAEVPATERRRSSVKPQNMAQAGSDDRRRSKAANAANMLAGDGDASTSRRRSSAAVGQQHSPRRPSSITVPADSITAASPTTTPRGDPLHPMLSPLEIDAPGPPPKEGPIRSECQGFLSICSTAIMMVVVFCDAIFYLIPACLCVCPFP